MKTEVTKELEKLAKKDKKLFFLTGDLGFNAFENLQKNLKERFINAGVAEQNMIDVSAGMAKMGLSPWVYSIAPFLILKTTEQIRNNICHPNLAVKLIGNGGGYGYGILGESHHMLEDIAILSSFPNIKIYVPAFSEDVKDIIYKMKTNKNPSYLRLNNVPKTKIKLGLYKPLRQLLKGNKVTVVTLGTLIHNSLDAVYKLNKKEAIDLFSVTEIPITNYLPIINSLRKTKKLLIIEEHTKNGGIGEKILTELMLKKVKVDNTIHLYAKGYVKDSYGCHLFMLEQNNLDTEGILKSLKKLYAS
ncbi:MAG: hypothetical protein A2152_02015 [Candidatus Levybacteria bacterium RBG_16_35_6]|nr:MAG: hypothetical protein A2152_02015 [Candidatus Levybacteria bacterium RBG_16_35_6]